MTKLARRHVYCPGRGLEIELLVTECESCALTRTNSAEAPLHPSDEP